MSYIYIRGGGGAHTDSHMHIHYALQTKPTSKSLHRQPKLGREGDSPLSVQGHLMQKWLHGRIQR